MEGRQRESAGKKSNGQSSSTDQLLGESWTVNGYASSDSQIYNPITPPQSSKGV
ncbi:predicted protein [Sclerotinia sclerotiorum 1980 UF-70]|uniref:Uncharacterized protein n=2 Tax=Sclerotinia sclerotiorum (strain ATCC 18683 / 1980 / Ss-1) TaxID=665079 RepID=A7EPW9_SCLS1|nr:predicted protein [Sclerotinia sclerotiorum 1980 UF-70]APA10201.1 hypothetical protein sscle_06g049710 [Sclerotinia sclerotiorum 1980 UF-70]EDO04885.1 predicted protein [Sclerotinia sclerotiorum 1980 UF-70]